jgi:hypothetical protein
MEITSPKRQIRRWYHPLSGKLAPCTISYVVVPLNEYEKSKIHHSFLTLIEAELMKVSIRNQAPMVRAYYPMAPM